MGRLADHVHIPRLVARSINLDRDGDAGELHGYIPTARAVDTVRRVLEGLSHASGTHAWSITGPYGSGKSSFALLLDVLCGPPGASQDAASALLSDLAPDVAKLATAVVEPTNGLLRATTVASVEPASGTLGRALKRACLRRWPRQSPRDVRRALSSLDEGPGIRSVENLLGVLASHAPVLVVIDEFGKNLEYHAEFDPSGLFILQEVAEFFSGSRSSLHGGVVTLQHLAFEDYASSISTSSRREWAKVQGRFEDISFTDSADQIVRLISDTVVQDPATKAMERRLRAWATVASGRAEELGLLSMLGRRDAVRSCYPLHPITAAALPDLCARYGQHERTLVSFLGSGEPDSVIGFCENAPDTEPLSTVGLSEVYDYFVAAARTLTGAAAGSARWLEIEGHINEAHVDDDDLALLKIVGVLNLVSGNGPLRASTAMVTFAADITNAQASEVEERLRHLAQRGIISYRAFADEFRLWNGTDFDVSGQIAAARELLSTTSAASLITDTTSPVPVIAGRHSQKTGILRYFDVFYADSTDQVELPSSSADGTLLYLIADPSEIGDPPACDRPVVLVTTPYFEEPAAAALEYAAIRRVLREHSETLATDWVARRELQERAAQARMQVVQSLDAAFNPQREGVNWLFEGSVVASQRGPSGVLSVVCDEAFDLSPTVRNEMIARRDLTSQGAKARRVLMQAMLTHEEEPLLGFDGYGPERAMYHAVLEEPGFHRKRSDGRLRLGPPRKKSDWVHAWRTLEQIFTEAESEQINVDDILQLLCSRPLGLKRGVAPVLLVAGLLHRADDVAIYEAGTYQPNLTADLVERLVRNPERYSVKNFAASSGTRHAVIDALGKALRVDIAPNDRRRNATILAVMAPLLGTIRGLPEYTLKTQDLTRPGVAVRDALLAAREPDEVLFSALPTAVGVEPAALQDDDSIRVFAERFADAVRELQHSWPRLLERIDQQLRECVITPPQVPLRTDLGVRAGRLTDRVLDPRLRAFLVTASDDSLNDDQDWIEAVAMTVSDKPVRIWRDRDWTAFVAASTQLGGTLRRLEALNFEHIARGTSQFSARRVTITNADGTETSTVVVADEEIDKALADTVDRLAGIATEELPRDALASLIARLTDAMSTDQAHELTRTVLGADQEKERDIG